MASLCYMNVKKNQYISSCLTSQCVAPPYVFPDDVSCDNTHRVEPDIMTSLCTRKFCMDCLWLFQGVRSFIYCHPHCFLFKHIWTIFFYTDALGLLWNNASYTLIWSRRNIWSNFVLPCHPIENNIKDPMIICMFVCMYKNLDYLKIERNQTLATYQQQLYLISLSTLNC